MHATWCVTVGRFIKYKVYKKYGVKYNIYQHPATHPFFLYSIPFLADYTSAICSCFLCPKLISVGFGASERDSLKDVSLGIGYVRVGRDANAFYACCMAPRMPVGALGNKPQVNIIIVLYCIIIIQLLQMCQ